MFLHKGNSRGPRGNKDKAQDIKEGSRGRHPGNEKRAPAPSVENKKVPARFAEKPKNTQR